MKDEISQLSNAQLSEALRAININVPITSSTRKICENRYRAYLSAQKEKDNDDNDNCFSNGTHDHANQSENKELKHNKYNDSNVDVEKNLEHTNHQIKKKSQDNLADSSTISLSNDTENSNNLKVVENNNSSVAKSNISNHYKPSATVSNLDKTSTAVSNHDKPSNAVRNHDKPSTVVSNHDKPSTAISNHDKPSTVVSNHDKPSELSENQCTEDSESNNSDQENTTIRDHNNLPNGDGLRGESNKTYYGVWVPVSFTKINSEPPSPLVFTSQKEALNAMKTYRGSRFKSFSSQQEAESFSTSNINNLSIDKICSMVATPIDTPPPVTKVVLKAPTFQELMKFRKAIEESNRDFIHNCLTSNPKYLISAGDMPVVLQEGSRLNAVHVAVKFNKLDMLSIILDALQSVLFFQHMYPDGDEENIKFRKKHLLDLYLNTPEKILCDTPLHIASKFGFADVLRKLIDFEQINVYAVNKDGKTCHQVICARSKLHGEENKSLKAKIRVILEEKAFIPLYENMECSCKVGRPVIALSPKALACANKKVKAFAGPMSLAKAPIVYERWGKSPKSERFAHIALSDYDRGMERLGRIISSEEKVPFNEFWSFLDCYTNLQTKTGLVKLENYLRLKYDRLKNQPKRHSFSAPKITAISKNPEKHPSQEDNVKKKLYFNDDESSLTSSDDMSSSVANVSESLCVCGELLVSCDKCGSVDIDLKNMSVTFNLRSPSKVSPDSDLAKRMSKLKIGDTTPIKTSVSTPTLQVPNDLNPSMSKSSSARDVLEICTQDLFIYGDFPSKLDNDVLLAIGDAVHLVNRDEFPFVYSWKARVQNYSWAEIKSWPTPESPRYKQKRYERSYLWTA